MGRGYFTVPALPELPGLRSDVDGGQSYHVGEAGHGQVVTFCHRFRALVLWFFMVAAPFRDTGFRDTPGGCRGWLSERQAGIVAHGNGIGGGNQHIKQLPV